MPNLVALSLMVLDKKIFKDFKLFSLLLPWQPEFLKESNSFKKSEEDHGRMHGRTTDNWPRHKLADLWPVELIISNTPIHTIIPENIFLTYSD